MSTPVFPTVSDDGDEGMAKAPTFSPNELLGGFLVGMENRLAELATNFANFGVPVFDRPLGEHSLAPLAGANREPTRADVEFLLRASLEPAKSTFPLDAHDPGELLFDAPRFNALVSDANAPTILGYRPLEDVSFLAPLVFYGPSGSGKTRLVEGICQRRRLLDPHKTLYYLSAFDFAKALNEAIYRDQTQLFRRLFSQAGVVAIENADVLSEREAAQLEFLPMLDAAIKARILVVLTFSKHPGSIPGLVPDLAARLCGGFLVPTSLPTEETRRVVVERVAQKLGLYLTPDVRETLVAQLPGSIGGICATLVQCAREFATFRISPNDENVRDFLNRRNPERQLSLEQIVKTVAKYFSVSIVEMRSKKRSKTLVLARKYIVYFARLLTNATFQDIGKQFSNRDHSTMIHATHEMEEEILADETTRFNLREIAKELGVENKLTF